MKPFVLYLLGMFVYVTFFRFGVIHVGVMRNKHQCLIIWRGETYNTDLYDLICLRKSEIAIESVSVCNVIETFAEQSIHSMPCFYTNVVIDLLP